MPQRQGHETVHSRELGENERLHAHLLACAELGFSILIEFRIPCLGPGATHIGLGFPPSINFIKTYPIANLM